MRPKKDLTHIYAISTISVILNRAVACVTSHDITWTGTGGGDAVIYHPEARSVTVDPFKITELQYFALKGFCDCQEFPCDILD